jgi:murein DD-endopeptidase MepM/ murein hydrolase activator NlpD
MPPVLMNPKSSSPDRRSTRRKAGGHAAYGVDLGTEPALNADGEKNREVDRRDVNLRWLCASVLTGLTGAALIGTSIHVALESAMMSVSAPQRAAATRIRAVSNEGTEPAGPRKGDKLVRTEMSTAARQSFRAPMTTRSSGDREAIKVRHFVRIATNLSLNTGTYATDIPPFNPMRLMAEDAGERYLEPAPVEIADADVAVLRSDLSDTSIDASAPTLSDDDVLSILEEERRLANDSQRRSAVPIPAQQMLSRTLKTPDALGDAMSYARIIDAPFSSIEVRVVPENVTNLPKSDQKASAPVIEEREIVLKKGDTVESGLRTYGASSQQIEAITVALGTRVKLGALPDGERMRILIGPGPRLGDARQIIRVILIGEHGIDAIAATNDRGVFVSVTPPVDETSGQVADAPSEEEDEGNGGVRLYESLYETALKNDLPRSTVEELVRIFGYDVDFQRRVASGDSFEVFYGADEDNAPPEILYAALSVGGEKRQVFRYQGDDGTTDFFDGDGRSLKKFLLRKPIADGVLRSGFGTRFHPILGYSRPHTGVDWANRIGTPIFSAGNGTIIKAGWQSGYGRRVEVQHANGYVTAYNHMSGFGKGINPGTKVTQGQVVGYLGSTGLSTGPHLHYEVMVNGHFVDPMKIRLPRGKELEGRTLAEFKRQRDQIEGLVAQADSPSNLAQRAELR